MIWPDTRVIPIDTNADTNDLATDTRVIPIDTNDLATDTKVIPIDTNDLVTDTRVIPIGAGITIWA